MFKIVYTLAVQAAEGARRGDKYLGSRTRAWLPAIFLRLASSPPRRGILYRELIFGSFLRGSSRIRRNVGGRLRRANAPVVDEIRLMSANFGDDGYAIRGR